MGGKRYYTCDYNYFDNIDTEEKAYWFGFLMGDGCVMHTIRDRHLKTCTTTQERFLTQLSLQSGDIDHLKKYNTVLQSTYPIKIYDVGKSGFAGNQYGRVLIEDKHLFDALVSHGMVEHKSLVAKFPDIDGELDNSFIRGYFDANGCISNSKGKHGSIAYEINIVSTKEMLYEIYQRIPKNESKEFTVCQRWPDRETNNYTFRIGGNLQLCNLMEYLYKGSTYLTRLDRKYEKAQSLLNLYGRAA